MSDVARIAGVSTSTVSHVVNRTRTVDPATEQQVRASIARLGYRPNTVARALATARTMNIGLCVPITANPDVRGAGRRHRAPADGGRISPHAA